MPPLVSVIMPVYNAEAYLGEAIESILYQTYKNFEFIIIDDLSTDKSWEIIQRYAASDSRIKIFQNPKNLKIVKTRNRGFAKSSHKAEYYAIMDADDISLPSRLADEVKFLEKHPLYAAVGSQIILINEESKRIGGRHYPVTYKKIKSVLGRFNPFSQSSIMIRRSVLDKIGRYNEKYTRCQDYELFSRIASKYHITNLRKPLLLYRISRTQGKNTHLKETIRFTIDIQKKYFFTFFRPWNIFWHVGMYGLLLLPTPIVLWLFKKYFF